MTPSSAIAPRLVCRHIRNIFARGRIPSAYFALVPNALPREPGNARTAHRADLYTYILVTLRRNELIRDGRGDEVESRTNASLELPARLQRPR